MNGSKTKVRWLRYERRLEGWIKAGWVMGTACFMINNNINSEIKIKFISLVEVYERY